MLMRNERLATLRTRYDDATGTLTIEQDGRRAFRADLRTREGRLAVEAFFRRFMPAELRGPPKVLAAPDGHRFTDSRQNGFVSIINLASVADLETIIGAQVHPLRFRANLYVTGWPAWSELEMVGETLSIGDVRLKVTKRIVRCAATNVDPVSGIRDLSIPTTLMANFDHMDCGVYARVVAGGEVTSGDGVQITTST